MYLWQGMWSSCRGSTTWYLRKHLHITHPQASLLQVDAFPRFVMSYVTPLHCIDVWNITFINFFHHYFFYHFATNCLFCNEKNMLALCSKIGVTQWTLWHKKKNIYFMFTLPGFCNVKQCWPILQHKSIPRRVFYSYHWRPAFCYRSKIIRLRRERERERECEREK